MDKLDIKYKKNYLTSVIFRLDVANLIDLNTSVLSKIQEDIIEIFPNYELVIRKKGMVNINMSKSTLEEVSVNIHIFSNTEKTHKFTIEEQSLSLEATKYSNFADFYTYIEVIIRSILKRFPHIVFGRMGLRYINEISLKEGHPLKWSDFISENLTYPIDNFFRHQKQISRYMSQIFYNYDDFMMGITYGIYNGEFPNQVRRKEFILDFDCSTTDINNLEIENILQKFNHKIKDEFEFYIKEPLRTEMEIINQP